MSISLVALAAASVAQAQATQNEPEGQPDADGEEIVVTATRLPGQVQTDIPPVLELDEAEVAAYGATSIADLVAQLAPQTGSGRGRGGRPVFLVNGQRVSGFREFSRFPPEAIRKVEVLPEEVALKFGFPADARVINFILKDDFASREVEAEFGMPTAGGNTTSQLEASLLRIAGARRINAGIDYQRTSPLTEAERGVIQSITPPASVIAAGLDPADFRTLVAREDSLTGNLTLTQGIGEMGSGGQFTVNGQVGRVVRRSLSGLDPLQLEPITRRTVTDSYALGSAYNRPLGDWRFSATLDAGRTDSDSQIDRLSAGGIDRALSRVWSANQKNTLAGTPFRLPGGEASLTLDAGYDWNRIESSDTRGPAQGARLTRGNLNGGANLSLPIASRREDFLTALGDLSLNISAGVDRLSDFGTLTDWNAGLTWKPAERLTLQASTIAREVAPGLSQLGAPQIVDVNVPVYDFTNGRTVLANVTTGGNPNLLAEKQRDLKLSASYDFDLFDRANLQVEYFRNRSENTTESFPLLTPAIEAAFPGRVTRGADGTLVAIDRRPVTFAERSSQRIRYGINLFGRVGKPDPNARSGRGGFGGLMATAQPAPAGAAMPGSAVGGPGGPDRGRFAEMQARLCATPAGQVPDLSGLPERMAERLKGADGQVDPARVAELRARFCNADGTPNAQAGPRRFDPAQFAALRTALACGPDGVPDPARLPPEVADRLKGPDGQIDPGRLTELRTRICAIPEGAQPGQGRWGGGRRGTGGESPQASGGPPASGPIAGPPPGGPSRGGGPRGGGMMGMMGGGDGQGRWNLSLTHAIELSNRALISAGGPALDLLEGDALGESGLSRHTVQLEGGVFYKGIGTRLSGNYRSASTVRGSGLPGSSDLRFGALTTFDLRTFVNLEQQKWLTGGEGPGFWKGTRLGLQVRNLFDTRQRITDANGDVPLRYQPGLVDPTGRFFEIEFRKMF